MAETENSAIRRIWRWVQRMRERWIALVFLASAVLWVEGTVRIYLELPEIMALESARMADLEARVGAVERALRRRGCGWHPCLSHEVLLIR